jgi:hypothetical protein
MTYAALAIHHPRPEHRDEWIQVMLETSRGSARVDRDDEPCRHAFRAARWDVALGVTRGARRRSADSNGGCRGVRQALGRTAYRRARAPGACIGRARRSQWRFEWRARPHCDGAPAAGLSTVAASRHRCLVSGIRFEVARPAAGLARERVRGHLDEVGEVGALVVGARDESARQTSCKPTTHA